MMKRLTTLCLLLLLTASASATTYEQLLCPMYNGRFLMIAGQLWFEITKEHDKPVEARRERVANPLDDRSHEVLTKRGTVGVEAHRDKKSGDLFIHWGTLKGEK